MKLEMSVLRSSTATWAFARVVVAVLWILTVQNEVCWAIDRSLIGASGMYRFPTNAPCQEIEDCCPPGASGPEGEEDCTECAGGSDGDHGMPRWYVTEPEGNIFLRDRPLAYQPSRGPAVNVSLLYKMQWLNADNPAKFDTNVVSLGRQWQLGWSRYVQVVTAGDTDGIYFNGNGTAVAISAGSGYDYQNQSRWAYTNSQFILLRSDGRKEYYAKQYNGIDQSDGTALVRYFITRSEDIAGNALVFNYITNSGRLRLDQVVDANGVVNSLTYTSSPRYASLVSGINNSFGQTVSFYYTNYTIISGGVTNQESSLSKVVDAAGIDTRFEYDSDGDLAAMQSPYGKTTFELRLGSDQTVTRVVEPNGAQHLYLYAGSFSTDLITNTVAGGPPCTTNGGYFSITNSFSNTDLNLRNSLRWGPRQVPLLSSAAYTVVTNGGFDLKTALGTNDVAIARIQHWLARTPGGYPSSSLALRKGPAPANGVPGIWTWYDYDGKVDSETLGTMGWPRLVAQNLPNGEARFTEFVRDSYGNVVQARSSYSDLGTLKLRTSTYNYATNGFSLISAINALGKQVVSNAYNSHNLVTNSYNALQEQTRYTYDAEGRLTSEIKASGLVSTNYYLTSGLHAGWLGTNVLFEVRGGTNFYYSTNIYAYNNGYLAAHTDTRGAVTRFFRDGLLRLTGVEFLDGTSISNVYTVPTNYFPGSSGGLGLLDATATKDRCGNWTYYTYNSKRQQVTRRTTIEGVDATTVLTYCDCGSLASITNAVGDGVSFTYDQVGRRTATMLPGGVTQSFAYDTANRLSCITNNLGIFTRAFNNQGLVISVSNSIGLVVTKSFDILDRVTGGTDGSGVAFSLTYDDLNRPLTRAIIGGGVESFTYGLRGVAKRVDPLGTNIWMEYDALGRLVAATNQNGEVTRFGFNTYGDLVTLTDGRGQVTTWRYDSIGRLTNKVDALGRDAFKLTYDSYSRLTNKWTPKDGGVEAKYAYNHVGWLTNVVYSHDPANGYRFDLMGRLIEMSDAVGTTTFKYQNGLLASEDGPWVDDTIEYSYDKQGRSGLMLAQPGAAPWVQTYSWDQYGRLAATASAAGTFSYQYCTNLNGVTAGYSPLVQRLTLPTSAHITNSFDAIGRVSLTRLYNGDALLDSHAYVYNDRNEVTRQTRLNNDYVEYAYDSNGQLRQAVGKESGGATMRLNEQLQYGYDASGNLAYRTNNALVLTFSTDAANQIASVSRNTSTNNLTVVGTTTTNAASVTVNGKAASRYADATFAADGFGASGSSQVFTAIASDASGRSDTNSISVVLPSMASFSYDQNGNLTTDGGRSFTYDDSDQLVQVVVTNGVAGSTRSQFQYDGQHRRRQRTESIWSGTVWVTNQIVRYVYDGGLVVQERDYNNLPLASYTLGRDLSGGLQSAGGIGGLLARSERDASGWKHTYFHGDRMGNITTLLDAGNGIAGRYLYDSQGGLLSGYGPMAAENLYRFSSKEFHVASGLYSYLYRYYDPNLQRWLNRDPVQELGGINLYAFVGNVGKAVDPFGLSSLEPEDVIDDDNIATPLQAFCKGARVGKFAEALGESGEAALDPKEWKKSNDVLAMIPIIGLPFNLANALISAAEGDWEAVDGYLLAATLPFLAIPGSATVGAVPKAAASGKVALDANILMGALEQGKLAAVDAAIAGRIPTVSITAVKEFLKKGDINLLREFLAARGGYVGQAATAQQVAQLRSMAQSLGRSLRPKDAAVAGSAINEGAVVITRDERFWKFLRAVGYPFQIPF